MGWRGNGKEGTRAALGMEAVAACSLKGMGASAELGTEHGKCTPLLDLHWCDTGPFLGENPMSLGL